MTTTVIIKNKEGSHWDIILTGGGTKIAPVVKLAPGEETEVTIWDGCSLFAIEEGDPV